MAERMKLLDLFCGAGGAAMGYHRAGFDRIVGVDHRPMPRYPFTFVLGDALKYVSAHGHEFDAIHASPPCQAYTVAQHIRGNTHPDLLSATRDALNKINRPWIIENVVGAPMHANLILCGSMFGLKSGRLVLHRHRLFESGGGYMLPPFVPATCHHESAISVFGHFSGDSKMRKSSIAAGREAMDISWMNQQELSEAIPPAYTEFIGRQLIQAIRTARQ